MDLSEILAITGKPGLFKMVAKTKNGVVVESLIDGKRIPAFAHEKISSLEEISIFTEDEDLSLKEVFKLIHDKQSGEKAVDHKSDNKTLKLFFEEVIPNYDKDRVYVSDIKKVINWYNMLVEKDILDFSEKEEKKEEEKDKSKTEIKSSEEQKTESEKETKPDEKNS